MDAQADLRLCCSHMAYRFSHDVAHIITGFICVGEMSGNFIFFQGQGIVREFHIVSGKNEILSLSGNFTFQSRSERKDEIFFFKIMISNIKDRAYFAIL